MILALNSFVNELRGTMAKKYNPVPSPRYYFQCFFIFFRGFLFPLDTTLPYPKAISLDFFFLKHRSSGYFPFSKNAIFHLELYFCWRYNSELSTCYFQFYQNDRNMLLQLPMKLHDERSVFDHIPIILYVMCHFPFSVFFFFTLNLILMCLSISVFVFISFVVLLTRACYLHDFSGYHIKKNVN